MIKLALAVAVFAACGPDNGSGSIPIDGLEGADIDAFCNIYVRCGVLPDQQTCHDLFGTQVMIDQSLVAAVHAGLVHYDGAKARECLDAFAGSTCDRSMLFNNRNLPAACEETFTGTVGDMGACGLDQECISGNCMLPTCGTGMCCQGTCVGGTPPVRPTVGQTCDGTVQCVDSWCDTAQTHTCLAYLADGAQCSSSNSCQSNSCNGTCQTLVATNSPCTTSTQCRNIGDTCPQTTMVCTPAGALGASCGSQSDCEIAYVCDTTKHCAARPAIGDACTGTSSGCFDSYCDTTMMKCVAFKADGAMCMSSSECLSKDCDTTTTHTCIEKPVCI